MLPARRRRIIAAAAAFGLFVAGAVIAYPQSSQPKQPDLDYVQGLEMWRTADLGNNSCSFCHSWDGIEIASYNFDDDTIRRRAEPHLGKTNAEKIVSFFHAVRRKYGLIKLMDPMKDRPLQPGGQPLPGDTPTARDNAFGESLKAVLPTLATGSIDSPQKAIQAKEELLKADPRKVPVGIVFNRISEDGFHGTEHATLAHWIPDEAILLKFPWGEYDNLADQYIEDLSPAKLQPIVEMVIFNNPRMYGQMMAGDKYRMLALLGHIFRLRAKGVDFFAGKGPVALADWPEKVLPNPFLELGVLADERQGTPLDQFMFPTSVLNNKQKGPKTEEQLKQMRLPALWLGWMFDEGFQRSGFVPHDRATRIITERLFSDGPYPFHAAFFISKLLVTDGFAAEAWNGKTPQHYAIDYSWFLNDNNLSKYEPQDAAAKALYRRFVANSFKMSLYLYRGQLEASHTKYADDPSLDQISKIQAYMKSADPRSRESVDELAAQINNLSASAVLR